MLALEYFDTLFGAVIEATAEAILNAMLQAETMTGRDGLTIHALDGEQLARTSSTATAAAASRCAEPGGVRDGGRVAPRAGIR